MAEVEIRNTPVLGGGTVAQEGDSLWRTNRPVPLSRQAFLDLLFGRTPLIKSANFITDSQSKALHDHLAPLFSPYLHATGPSVEKVGIAQFEFQAQSQEDFLNRKGDEKARYFSEAAKLSSLHIELSEVVGVNVWAKVVESIRLLVPEWDVEIASEGEQQQYFSGIFRKINGGTPIHCDWCPYDCLTEDWILSKITCQAVFNLYISPTKGGHTTIHDVHWMPEALEYRDPATYGYSPGLIEGRDSVTFKPEVEDLYLFNSRNMHEVAPVDPDWPVPRIALASFMGLLPSEVTKGRPKLIFWS
ncbi:hypothetical protein B9Z65_8344 [Elsinoe australis]|uniref:Prolyl 4-hydroxylase alpha subunit Fe(2+) 2OG dioxygenase domain-containing protein n=1 Tax=Elsinoe australis TaxID=40998 RepID=A0A2P7YDH1_9PEZI|nr:hypothetical protein B9Z65_8344 [Elsinoe australis]